MNHLFNCLFLIATSTLSAQSYTQFIAENAVAIASPDSLNESIYLQIKDKYLIMVGEMHGTMEPALLVQGFAHLFTDHGEKVLVGLEIPASEMEVFTGRPSDSSLWETHYFTKENTDGRNGQGWFNLIHTCSQNPNVNLFFFDNFEAMHAQDRDSAMYASVKQQRLLYPDRRIITISGNIHNQIIPRRGRATMGSYCVADSAYFKPDQILSVRHIYTFGKMMNNTGHGLEMHVIEPTESLFSQAVHFPNYFISKMETVEGAYNSVLFTREVHHSSPLPKKGK